MPTNAARPNHAAKQRNRLLALLGFAVAVLVAFGLADPSGGSAATLVAAEPADGDRLPAAPPAVTLRFSGPLDPAETHLDVIGPDGPIAVGEAVVRDDTVRQSIELDTAARVLVAYHAVLRDGRQVTGRQEFVVAAGGGEPQAPDPPAASAGHSHGEAGPLASLAILLIMVAGVTVLVVAFRTPSRR